MDPVAEIDAIAQIADERVDVGQHLVPAQAGHDPVGQKQMDPPVVALRKD